VICSKRITVPSAAREAAAKRADPLTADPDLGQQVGREQPREGRRVEAVGLDARVRDRPHLGRVDHDHTSDVRPDDPGHLHRRPRRLERDPVVRAEALGEEAELLGFGLDPARRADLTGFRDRHLAEARMHIERY
jgi:hypothetical protein